jgi:hypothetical protein
LPDNTKRPTPPSSAIVKRLELTHSDYVKLWVAEAEKALIEESRALDADELGARLTEITVQIGRMVVHIINRSDSPTLADALCRAETERSRLEARLSACDFIDISLR